MTIYLGQVSYDLHSLASYVRVAVFGTDGIPLSVKATRNGFSRNYFTKGRTVEVERCKSDGTRFRVTKVFEALNPTKKIVITHNFNIIVPTPADLGYGNRSKTMPSSFTGKAMSHDRVRFFLSDCYYNTGCKKDAMQDVLKRAFDLGEGHSGQHMTGSYGGFYIVCRPSQFARFMVYRNEAGQKNGFIDLQVKLFTPEPPKDAYTKLAEKAGISRDQAKRVSYALCFSGHDEVRDRLKDECYKDGPPEVDVSMNKHLHSFEGGC